MGRSQGGRGARFARFPAKLDFPVRPSNVPNLVLGSTCACMSEMIIKIQEIGPEGEHRSLPFEPAWWKTALGGLDAQLGASRAGADVDIHKVGENVMVHGRLYGAVTVPCARCLTPALVDLAAAIHMTYSRD